MGLFDADTVDNDLSAVDNAIRAYYGIANKPMVDKRKAPTAAPPAPPGRQAPAAPAQPVDDIDDDIPFN